MSRVTFVVAAIFVATISIGSAAHAQSPAGLTGLDKMHQQTNVGGKVCMTDHEHGGEGALSSRKGAEAAAIRHWEGFTAWEYGKPWGRYSVAAGRKMECKNGGSGWVCSTRARPCRLGGR